MELRGKVLIAQGGGPTAVINQSLVGAVLESRKFPQVARVYGAVHGVEGIINEQFWDLTKETTNNLERVAVTPSSALLSTRIKPDQAMCKEMFHVMKVHDIRYFFYIGGNDSADTVRIINEEAIKADYELRAIHIPKTIDNDLVLNDHTPGYGSAAKFVAEAFVGANLDNRALPGVYIGVVMGRHAGFLTAVTVENYDPGGRISVSSPLWENEISLTLINGKYYGLLPIPLNTAAGAYELLIAGSNSSETLQYKESLTVSAPAAGIAAVSAKNAALLSKKAAADPYYLAIAQTNAGTSQGEKLWHGNFTYPAAIAVTYIYGQKLAYRDFSYQPFCQIYAFTGDAEIFAAASGIVRLAEQTPDLGGTVVIDHGLGVFSVYSELSELSVSAGGYIFARQKLGQCAKTETVPTPAFTYGVIVNGYYVNPRAFFEHDPISFYR